MRNIVMLMTDEERHAMGIAKEEYNRMIDQMAEEAEHERLYELGFTCYEY